VNNVTPIIEPVPASSLVLRVNGHLLEIRNVQLFLAFAERIVRHEITPEQAMEQMRVAGGSAIGL
jgi:hypothetical protein